MQVDVCQITYDTVAPHLPDEDGPFNELLEWLKDRIDSATFDQIESVCNLRVSSAQEAAFWLGWQLRGSV